MSLQRVDRPIFTIDSLTDFDDAPNSIRKAQLYFLNGATPKIYACFDGSTLVEIASSGGGSIVFTPSGNIEAVTVQDAIVELDAEKMATWVTKPSAANSAGTAGQLAYESGFLYVCVATNTWERVVIATWP